MDLAVALLSGTPHRAKVRATAASHAIGPAQGLALRSALVVAQTLGRTPHIVDASEPLQRV